MRGREEAAGLASGLGDVAVRAVGTAAGATVAPGTAVRRARSSLLTGRNAVVALALAAAFVLGRRTRRP